jgi:DNA-binding NarL/FixJ family response regulator
VVKDVERTDLKRKIRAAARGEGVLDEKAASPVLERLRRGARAPVQLTEREITILKLTAEGMTNKEIGQQLYLSEATVKDQLRKIMDKFGVDHRISAVIAASKEGLI